MDLVIRKNDHAINLVSVFTVEPQNQEKLVRMLEDGTETVVRSRQTSLRASSRRLQYVSKIQVDRRGR